MAARGRRFGVLSLALLTTLGLAACGPANERPVRGAVPGHDAASTTPGLPPTLTASEALRLRAIATPSPSPSPSPAAAASPVASPSTVAPPIVRTIVPSANGHLPSGAAVNLSAVLVGRGADLASASLLVNGADSGAQIDKRTPREWAIHTSQALANGTHTARVLVRDASGAAGGFTWQFMVGEDEPPPAPTAPAAAATTAVPKPRTP